MKQLLVKQTEHIDEDFILKKCNNLLKEAEIKKAPIDPKILASFCDIKMVNEKKMNEAGMLIPLKQGGAKILLRLSDNSRRKRFTCCHEIVHTFFPDYQLNPQKRVDEETGIYDNKNNTEYLCDLGASELLIPSFLFNPKFETMGFSMGTLQRLADDFDSSLEATAIKMVKTDLDNKRISTLSRI